MTQEQTSTPALVMRAFAKDDPRAAEDVDFIIGEQLALYDAEQNFNSDIWRTYLIQGVHALADNFDPKRDCIFILEKHEGEGVERVGGMAAMHISETTAQLRYFFLRSGLRGLGAGGKLFGKALDFCREAGYKHVFLWTANTQGPARKLYEKLGFVITESAANDEWGAPVIEERWDLDL